MYALNATLLIVKLAQIKLLAQIVVLIIGYLLIAQLAYYSVYKNLELLKILQVKELKFANLVHKLFLIAWIAKTLPYVYNVLGTLFWHKTKVNVLHKANVLNTPLLVMETYVFLNAL